MEYGYVIAFKDKDGFERAHKVNYGSNPLGMFHVFSLESSAQAALTEYKLTLMEYIKYGQPIKGEVEKTWFFKKYKETVIEYIPLSREDQESFKKFRESLYIKKVKIA